MIININLAGNNSIYYYDIKKDKATKGYNAYAYQSVSAKKQDLFPVLKDIIIAKKEVDAEFFINKLNKTFKCALTYTKSFGQTAKQIVTLMNSYKYTVHSLRQPLILSIPYLNGKPLPKIEKICLIDNNMYFITKCKKEYIMQAVNDENMKCVIPLSNIINLYRKLRRAPLAKKNIKKKPNLKRNNIHFHNIDSCAFQAEDTVVSPQPQSGRIRYTRITPDQSQSRTPDQSQSRTSGQLIRNGICENIQLIEPLLPPEPIEQNDEEIRVLQAENALTEQVEPEEVAEPAITLSAPSISNNSFYYNIEVPIDHHTDINTAVLEQRIETIYDSITPNGENNPLPTEGSDALLTDETVRNTLSNAERDSLSNIERTVLSAINRRVANNDSDSD